MVKETAALRGNETLNPKEELQRLMDQLKQLTDSGEGRKKLSKELDDGVSNFLKTHQDIVGTVKDIYVSLDPKAKEGLESLMKLAKVDEEVRDEQREINVRLEALKQEAVLQESQKDSADLEAAILSDLETKISTLMSQGKFQEALDNSVFLLTEKNKGTAYRIIKNILQHAPRGVTLYVKDKKIAPSDRAAWIKKMDDNMESAAREGSASVYFDGSISGVDEWTLDETKASKKRKEKKAIKDISKEILDDKKLYKLSKRLNMPSALTLIESNISKIKELFSSTRSLHPDDNDAAEAAFRDELSKQFFIDNKYITKSGVDLASSKKFDDLSNKEHEALQDLCIYRMTVDILDENAQNAYRAFVRAEISGVTVSELNQSRTILDQVKVDGLEPNGEQCQNILMTLLGDLNWDGRLTNTSAVKEGKDREGLDKGTLFGGQMASMFEGAVKRFGAAKVVGNIETVIQSLNGLKEFKVGDPKTIVGLINAFKANPSALIAFRGKLVNEPDSGMSMFNVGTEYVNRKIDRVKAEEKFRGQCQEFFTTPEGENLLNSLNDKIDKEVLIPQIKNVVLPNLIKFRGEIDEKTGEIKETEAYSKLSRDQKKHINTLIELFSSDEGIKEFLSADEVREMYKNFIISGIGVNFADINVDGEHIFGVGAQAGVTNEKFNAWLSKSTANIISKASASVGLYCTDGNVSVGLGLGFGSTKNLGDNARAFYNVGGSWSPFNPKGLSFSAVVGAETRVNPSADDALDLKASHYIGVAGAYGIGLNLSDSHFNINNVSASVYWRKDKLEGVEKNADKIKEKMVPIFQELFRIDGEMTPRLIMEKLRGGTMNNGEKYNGFAKSSGEALYSTAVGIYNMFVSYKGKLKLEANAPEDKEKLNEAVIKKMSEDFADNLARATRNKNIEKIVDEGLYLSGVNVGVTWSFARLFTGFFISGGVSFTYYEDAQYKENQNMLDIARDGMNNENYFETITNEEGSYQRKMEIINDMLRGDYLKYYPEVKNETTGEVVSSAFITLSKETFNKDIKVLCNSKLAPYIVQKDGMIKLPGNADVSLAKIMHQGKAEYTLILGANSALDCEEVVFDKNEDKLKWQVESNVVFGSKEAEFDKYNTTITTKVESMNVGIDGKANDDLVKYLVSSEGANELVNFRLSGKWSKFTDFIKANPDRGGETEGGKKKFIEDAKALLPDGLKNVKDAEGKIVDVDFTVDDIRFIYASLSRVSQTRDKQLSGTELKKKANEYLEGLHLSKTNNALLERYISIVGGGKALSDEEWGKMKSILGINYNNWEYKTSSSNAEKLFHILTPVKKLAERRTDSYKRRIRLEYEKLDGGADVLINARNESLKKLEGKPTANGEIRGGWIGAVAGYEDRKSITDKFVSSPKIISESDVLIPESDNLKKVKQHFLVELSRDDAAQFNNIKKKIVETLEKSTKAEDKKIAQEWRAMHDAEFIEAILNSTTENEKNEAVNIVSFNMKYGFFADCVNETILLGDINVVTTTEQQVQAPHDVHYYDAVVTNDAVTTAHSVSIGATYGIINPKETDYQPTKPEGDETKTNTKPLSDLDQLSNNKDIVTVDFENQEFVWDDPETGTRRYMMYAYDSDLGAYVAYDFDDPTNPSWIMAENGELIRSENWVPSNLGSATEVPMPSIDDVESDVANYQGMSRKSLALELHHLGQLLLLTTDVQEKAELARKIKEARRIYNIKFARRAVK